ncbi:MAG: S-methyl-5-thioribose-1-phosphate isomerase, partial [Candidatus Glassbacteria bacterium]
MTVETITWVGKAPAGRVRLIDQTELPAREIYLERTSYLDLAEDIRRLAVRGAPAIGVAGAFGVVLGLQPETGLGPAGFRRRLTEVCGELATTRPTAVNLFWAVERMKRAVEKLAGDTPAVKLLEALEAEALAIRDQDRALCRA